MRNNHPSLREIYRSYIAELLPPGIRACPSPEEIARSFESSAPGRVKRRVIDHITACPTCRDEFMMVLEQEKAAEGMTPSLGKRASPGATAHKNGLGNAAYWQWATVGLGLAFVISSLFFLRYQPTISHTRQIGKAEVSLITPELDRLIASPFLFQWQGQKEDDYYVLEIYDEELKPIWTSDKIWGRYIFLPTDVSARLLSGRHYFWLVTSYVRGHIARESHLGRFVMGR